MEYYPNSTPRAHPLEGFQALHPTLGHGTVTRVARKDNQEYVFVRFDRDGKELDFSIDIFTLKWGNYFSHTENDLKAHLYAKSQNKSTSIENTELESNSKYQEKQTGIQLEHGATKSNSYSPIEKIENLKQKLITRQAEDSELIQDFISTRNILALTHFTRVENLFDIFDHGIVSRLNLPATAIVNDEYRYENFREASCLTISFPNWQMFWRYQCRDKSANWAVLSISPDILLDLPCLFYPTNAANSHFRSEDETSLIARMGFQGLSAMFRDYPNGARRSRNLLENWTTDPQAEVLCFESIPSKYIISASLARPRHDIQAFIDREHPTIKYFLGGKYFGPRADYEHWKSNRNSDFDDLDDDFLFDLA